MTTPDPDRLAVYHSLAASLTRVAHAHRAVIVSVVFFPEGDAASIVCPSASREADMVWTGRALVLLQNARHGKSDFETTGRAPGEG